MYEEIGRIIKRIWI